MIANDNHQPLAARAFREVQAQLQLRGETSACGIFEATRAALDLPEEECGGEIHDAMFFVVRQGLVDCNTRDTTDNSITIGRDTVLTPVISAMH